MGLTAWDIGDDDFDHSQLATNFVTIDNHNHETGRGLPIGTNAIAAKAITNTQLGEEAVHGENVQKGAIGAEQIDPNFLPLGVVIPWYTQGSTAPGGAWEVCDGRAWSGITNGLGYSTGNIPDLREKFILGAKLTGGGVSVGSSGGNSTINVAHAHTVESHTHTVGPHTHSISSHVHGGSTSTNGAHIHGFGSGHQLFQRITKYAEVSGKQELQSLWDTFTSSTGETEVPMTSSGEHFHNFTTDAGGAGNTGSNSGYASGAATPNTDSQLGSVNITPPYVGLVYIMKVR